MLLWADLPNLRDTRWLLIQIWILRTANCLKNIFYFIFLNVKFLLNTRPNNSISESFYASIQEKNKVYNSEKCRRYTWKICGRHVWPNLAGQISPCSIENPQGRRFWVFSDQIFNKDFISRFVNVKTWLRDHTGANVSLAKFQSPSNVK